MQVKYLINTGSYWSEKALDYFSSNSSAAILQMTPAHADLS